MNNYLFRNVLVLAALLVYFLSVYPFLDSDILLWDDWVWAFNSDTDRYMVPIQLGFWWLSSINVWLYSDGLPNGILVPAVIMCHIVTTILLGWLVRKFDLLQDDWYWIFIALYLVSPGLLVSYINSVAFYSLYLLLFVLGVVLFLQTKNKIVCYTFSFFCFFLSFSLASLIPLYYLLIGFFFYYAGTPREEGWEHHNLAQCMLLKFKRGVSLAPILFIISVFIPAAFYLFKKVGGSVIQNRFPENTNPYSNYNLPNFGEILSTPLTTISNMFSNIFEILFGIGNVDQLAMSLVFSLIVGLFVFLSICGPLVKRIMPFKTTWRSREPLTHVCSKSSEVMSRQKDGVQKIILLLLMSIALLFPYVLVGKIPDISDFFDARHLIVSLPALLLLMLSVLQFLFIVLQSKVDSKKIAIATIILGLFLFINSASRAVIDSSKIWFQNVSNNAVIEEIVKVKTTNSLWIFEDFRINYLTDRMINYEYTGMLISALGERKRFGVSKAEFASWKEPLLLFHDDSFRNRYNLPDFEFDDLYQRFVITQNKKFSPTEILILYLASFVKTDIVKLEKIFTFKTLNGEFCSSQVFNALEETSCRAELITLQNEEGYIIQQDKTPVVNSCNLSEFCESMVKGGKVFSFKLNSSGFQVMINKGVEKSYALQVSPENYVFDLDYFIIE